MVSPGNTAGHAQMEECSKLIALLGLTTEEAQPKLDLILKYRQELDALNIPTTAKILVTKQILALTKEVVTKNHRLIIIKGIPGSGKTTYAKQIKDILKIVHNRDAVMQEADMYMGPRFDPKKLQSCHDMCQANTKANLQDGKLVIVSNTSTTKSERSIYMNIARTGVLITEPPTPWKYDIDICQTKCIHKGIPKQTYVKYLDNIKGNK